MSFYLNLKCSSLLFVLISLFLFILTNIIPLYLKRSGTKVFFIILFRLTGAKRKKNHAGIVFRLLSAFFITQWISNFFLFSTSLNFFSLRWKVNVPKMKFEIESIKLFQLTIYYRKAHKIVLNSHTIGFLISYMLSHT